MNKSTDTSGIEDQVFENELDNPNDEEDNQVASSDEAVKPYDFNQDEFTVIVNALPSRSTPYNTTHVFRRPTFEEEEAHERMMPYDTEQAGRMEGRDAVRPSFEVETAHCNMYDRIITSFGGFGFDNTVKRFEGHPTKKDDKAVIDLNYDKAHVPNQVITGVNPEELVEITHPKSGSKIVPFKAAVPGWIKGVAIFGMFSTTIESDMEGIEVLSLGAGREWKVRQEIGGGRNPEDGSFRPPQYVLSYFFEEPTEQLRRQFRSKAVNSVAWSTKGGNEKQRRTTNLRVVDKIFNELIIRIEGCSMGDDAFDATNVFHLKRVFGNFKKMTLSKLFKDLDADLGN